MLREGELIQVWYQDYALDQVRVEVANGEFVCDNGETFDFIDYHDEDRRTTMPWHRVIKIRGRKMRRKRASGDDDV